MLTKSRKNALLMAVFFAIPMAVIAVVVGQIRYASLPTTEQNPNVTNGFAGVGPALMALAVLGVSLAVAAFVIYRLDESHYGPQGAVRWAAAGTIYGALQQVVLTPIPSDFDFAASSILRQIGGDLLWKLVTLVLTYLLVFPVMSRLLKLSYQGRRHTS